jgi:Asp/Glu/hydantoin racemase
MGRRKITLIHASRASVEPLNSYYPKQRPELEITNLLDDGVMGLFSTGEMERARQRLSEMIAVARDVYSAELAVLACSAVPREDLEMLRASAAIPVLKIDEPMARASVQAGQLIGVIVSFPPTQRITHALLDEAAGEIGRHIGIIDELIPEALHAMLNGDKSSHDRMLASAAQRLASRGSNAIVLAQVSMAHMVPVLIRQTGLPVFSSLETSLDEVRQKLGL